MCTNLLAASFFIRVYAVSHKHIGFFCSLIARYFSCNMLMKKAFDRSPVWRHFKSTDLYQKKQIFPRLFKINRHIYQMTLFL